MPGVISKTWYQFRVSEMVRKRGVRVWEEGAHLALQLKQTSKNLAPWKPPYFWMEKRDSCVDPISWQRRVWNLEGRDFMKFTILIAVWRTSLRSGSSVLDARASLWIKQWVNLMCGATLRTLAFSPLVFPSIAPAPSVHMLMQSSQFSPASSIQPLRQLKMSPPVHLPSSREQNFFVKFPVITVANKYH